MTTKTKKRLHNSLTVLLACLAAFLFVCWVQAMRLVPTALAQARAEMSSESKDGSETTTAPNVNLKNIVVRPTTPQQSDEQSADSEDEGTNENRLPPGYSYVSRGPAAGVKGGKTCDYRLEPGHPPWIKGEGIRSVTLVVNKHTGNIYGADSHAVPNEFKKFGDCRFVEIKQTVNGVDYWRPTVVLDE